MSSQNGPLRPGRHPVDPCEMCGEPARYWWGMDLTPLCKQHYQEAEANYEYWAVLSKDSNR